MVISATLIPPAPPDVGPSREEIAAVATQIANRFHPEQIRLFGSRAYGTPHKGSDVDLLVVWDTALARHDARERIAEGINASNRRRFQLHVYTPDEIRLGLREHDFFVEDMMLKGILLYKREGTRVSDEYMGVGSDHEPGTLKQAARRWLDRANEAASSAERLLTDPSPRPNYTCFLVQQGVELTLKGLLQQEEVRFARTHDLDELARLALPLAPALAEHHAAFALLTICAVEARYGEIDISPAQAKAAVETMGAVRALILPMLPNPPGETRPGR